MKSIAGVGLIAVLALVTLGARTTKSRDNLTEPIQAEADVRANGLSAEAAEPLEFRELVHFDSNKPQLSAKVKALSGRRVKMVGYAAHLEQPSANGFYLTPVPVHGDESGGGTADLPVESVLVVVDPPRSPTEGESGLLVEVTGLLDVGHAEDSEGRAHWLRLTPD